jgi:hypothetical protein
MTIIREAPSCIITYDCHSDDSMGVIHAPRVINYAPTECFLYRPLVQTIKTCGLYYKHISRK